MWCIHQHPLQMTGELVLRSVRLTNYRSQGNADIMCFSEQQMTGQPVVT